MINKVILLGNVGNIQSKTTHSGTVVANISVATNEVWHDKDGGKKTKTEWHNIVLFGRQAENANRYLKKGDRVYIEGKIQTSSWETQDGQKRYKTDIVIDNRGIIKFLGSSGGGTNATYASNTQQENQGAPQKQQQNNNNVQQTQQSSLNEMDDDDVPF